MSSFIGAGKAVVREMHRDLRDLVRRIEERLLPVSISNARQPNE